MKNELDNTRIVFEEDWIDQIVGIENSFLIIDKNVFKIYSTRFQPIINSTKYYLFEASEKNKSFSELQKILLEFQSNNLNRKSVIICIGGGITTDIGGLAASLYMRGCRLILIPTTLLGMVDAAIGGKTGVNFCGIKNSIGSFYPAQKVIVDPSFLNSLSQFDYLTGMVEIVKMSFLEHTILPELIAHEFSTDMLLKESILTKLRICRNDPYDRSSRHLLNLGHTFGHILESISGFEITHGTAVAIGIRAAANYSLKAGFIDEYEFIEITKRLDKFDLPVKISNKYRHLLKQHGISVLKKDKKSDSKVNLILFKNKMELFVYQTDEYRKIFRLLEEYIDDQT